LKTKTKQYGLLFGAFLFSCLLFIFLSGKGSSNPGLVQSSAQDRVGAIRKLAKQAQKDIVSSKSDSLAGKKAKEKEEAEESEVGFPVYGNHWGKEIIPELRDFSKWADEYTKSPQRTKEQVDEGVERAKARREIMRTLIEMDPEAALASAIPRDIRVHLPREVLDHSEEHVAGIGNMSVKVFTPETGANGVGPLVKRMARVAGDKYQAHVYGQMKGFGTVDELYLHGVAVEDQLAVAETPMRPLEVGEPLVANKPVQADHPVGRTIANQVRSEGIGPFFAEGKNGYGCLCCKAAAWDDYDAYFKAAAGGSGLKMAAIGRAYNNTGAKKLLLIPVEFPDKTGSPWSAASVGASRASDIQTYFNAVSYGNFTLPTIDTATLQTMDNNASYYTTSHGGTDGDDLLRDHAIAKALTAGYDKDDYEFVSIVINHNLYSWAGLGQMGSKYHWIDGTTSGSELDQETTIYTHELGHNLGLYHANAWDSATTTADDTNGTHVEYGHEFDVMGDTYTYTYDQLHYNASFKHALDWLPDSSVTTLTSSSANATLDLHAMDQTHVGGRVYAVKIDTGITLGTSSDLDYWVEFRSRYPSVSTLDDGVLIYTSNDAHTDTALKLLDMTPSTSTFSDAGLDLGETFTTADSRFTITVNSQSGSGASSLVNISITDARSAPFITSHPASSAVKYSNSVTLSVSAAGTGLTYQWYKESAALSGETNSTLVISDFQADNKGDYYVTVTNTYGSTTSNTATLSQDTGGGGGGGCGSMPPVNLVVIGWFSLFFSRLCLWLNFGAPRTSQAIPKTKKRKRMKIQVPIFLLVAVLVWGGAGCTSIEARAKGAQKPFPGIRYLKDSRHSMYGEKGALVTRYRGKAAEDQTGCFWDEAGEAMLYSWPAFMDDEMAQALCLICYWPVDFAATLGLDTALLPFDALDKHAQDKKAAEE
jgi:uncharacterized protein YceK